MTSEKISHSIATAHISHSILTAHDSVAFNLAESYLANLAKDTDNTLGTLDGQMYTFHFELAEMVAVKAARLGAKRCKYRRDLLGLMAMDYVRAALRTNPEQAEKLKAIRAAQDAKARTEAMAEQAKWVPVPKVA